MEPYPVYESNAGKDIFDDEVTQARVRTCKERLTERLNVSFLVPERGHSANHHLGSQGARSCTMMQRLHGLLKARRYEELSAELARAELAQELSEFHALNFQAILSAIEGSEFASDYLEMAEAVASSPYERAVIAEHRAGCSAASNPAGAVNCRPFSSDITGYL